MGNLTSSTTAWRAPSSTAATFASRVCVILARVWDVHWPEHSRAVGGAVRLPQRSPCDRDHLTAVRAPVQRGDSRVALIGRLHFHESGSGVSAFGPATLNQYPRLAHGPVTGEEPMQLRVVDRLAEIRDVQF